MIVNNLTLIAAFDEGRVIGKDDALPWHIPEDLKHFKATTKDHAIVMGRKTYMGLPFRPLPHRTNIVITRGDDIEGALCFPDIDRAIISAFSFSKEVFVIGGQSIYEQTIGMADRLLITHVDGNHDGNHYFPVIPPQWCETSILQEGDGFRMVEYRR